MSAPTQADLFKVLLDRAEQDGGLAVEIRQWIADHLVPLKILSPWDERFSETVETVGEGRLPLGANRDAPSVCVLWMAGDDGPVPWRGEYRGTARDGTSMDWWADPGQARRNADRGAREHGWVLADRPLEQLARRLLELGEHPPAVEDMLERTHPSKSFWGHYQTYGHDPKVRDCLTQLGFLPIPDTSWLTGWQATEHRYGYRGRVHWVLIEKVGGVNKHPLLQWLADFYLLADFEVLDRDPAREGAEIVIYTYSQLPGVEVTP